MEQLRRHLQKRSGLSGGSIGPLDRRYQWGTRRLLYRRPKWGTRRRLFYRRHQWGTRRLSYRRYQWGTRRLSYRRRRWRHGRALYRRHQWRHSRPLGRRFARVLDERLDRLNRFDGITRRGHWFILRWQEPKKLVSDFEANPLAWQLYMDLGNRQLVSIPSQVSRPRPEILPTAQPLETLVPGFPLYGSQLVPC